MSRIQIPPQSKFGRLIILHELESINNKRYFLCKCECGKETRVSMSNLKTGHTKSCGCLNDEIIKKQSITHGLSHNRLYWVLVDMKMRCYNKKRPAYRYYGIRGITICQEWLNNPTVFYNWAMANGYQNGLQIDRINNDGNYEPSNCRWVEPKINARNRRTIKLTEEKAEEIRYLVSVGATAKQLSKLYSTTSTSITNVILNRTWITRGKTRPSEES